MYKFEKKKKCVDDRFTLASVRVPYGSLEMNSLTILGSGRSCLSSWIDGEFFFSASSFFSFLIKFWWYLRLSSPRSDWASVTSVEWSRVANMSCWVANNSELVDESITPDVTNCASRTAQSTAAVGFFNTESNKPNRNNHPLFDTFHECASVSNVNTCQIINKLFESLHL